MKCILSDAWLRLRNVIMLFSSEMCAQSCTKCDDGVEMRHVKFFTSFTLRYPLRPLPLPIVLITLYKKSTAHPPPHPPPHTHTHTPPSVTYWLNDSLATRSDVFFCNFELVTNIKEIKV